MAKSDKKADKAVGKKMFDDVTNSSVDARNAVDEFYKNLLKGGKKAQPILDELSKLFSNAGNASQKAADKIKSSSKELDAISLSASRGKKEFDSLQKTLASYDGPRFKAAGLITEELSNQLNLNEMINKSKISLQDLDSDAIGYSKLLSDSSQELVDINNARYDSIKQLNDAKSNSNSLTGELIGLLKDESELADRIAETNVKSFDLAQKLQKETDPEKINQLEKEGLQLRIEGLDLDGKLLENKKNQKSINDSLQTSLETEANLKNDLQVLADNRLKTEKDIAFQTAINNDTTGRLRATFENINKINDEQIGSQGELAKKMQEVEDSAYNVGTAQFRQIDLMDDITDRLAEQRNLEAARTTILDTNNGLTAQQRTDALALIDSNIKINQEQLKHAQALQAASEAYQTVNDKAESLRDSMMAPVDKLFGIVPSGISQMLGLDKIQSEMKDKLFKSISDGFMGASGGVSGFFSAASAGASTLMASLAPILPLLLAIAAVVGLVKLFMDADKAVGQLSKDLGVSYTEAAKIQGTATDIANEMNVVGINTAEVTKQMVDLKAATGLNFGILAQTNDKAKGLLETSTLLSAQFGTTAEENLALNSAAAITGTTLDKMALTAMDLGDEFVSSGELMKDIGKVSKGVLFNFKGNVKALAQAVKQAKLMGTTLDKMNSVGENLMNIETQIAAQNKARVMLGKNINMDAARYFYMTGDTAKMMDAMVQQMGSAGEYEKLGPYQRKLYAEAMGMGVDQLDEMMAKQKELETMGIDQTKLQEILNKDKEGSLNLEKELAGLKDEEARGMLKQKIEEQRRVSIQEKLADTMQKVTGLLFKLVEPLLPMIDSFVDSLGDGKGVLQSLSDTFSGIGKFISSVLIPILKVTWSPIMATFSFFKTIIDKIGEAMNGIFGPVKEGESSFSALGAVAKVLGKIFSGIGVVIADYMLAPFMRIAGIIGGVIKIFNGDFAGGIKQIGGAILSFILLPFEMVGDFIDEVFGTNLVDSVKEIFSNVADGILDILGGVWDVISGIFTLDGDRILEGIASIGDGLYDALVQPFMDAWDWITGWFGGNSPSKLGKSIVLGISSVAGSLFDFLTAPFKMAWDFIGNLFGMGNLGSSIIGGFKSVFSEIGDMMMEYIGGAWDVVSGIFTLDGDKILEGLKSIGNSIISMLTYPFEKAISIVTNLFGNVGEKIVNGISSVGSTIVDSITAPFTQAWDNISGWLGFSPSELGNGIVKGISSVGSNIESSLTKPFENAEQQVTDSAKGMADSISNISGDASISIKGIDTAGISQIKDIEKDLRRIKVDTIEEKLGDLSDAFSAMDWSLLKEFANLATVNLGDAGKSLINGINSLTGISKSVDLDKLEDVFDQLSDTLDELNWENLKIFSELATTNLAAAGKSLIDGINSLTGITKDVNLSELEDTFSDLMDTLEELDWDVLKTFSSLATTNLSEAGKSIIGGINSLTGITKDVNLGALEDTFSDLTDTLNELDWENLKIFASLATSNLANAGKSLIDGINSLTGISNKVNLDKLKDVFEKLTDTLNELDWEDLKVFASLATSNLANAGSSIIAGINSLAGIKDKINLGGAEDAFEALNDVLDELDLNAIKTFADLAGKNLAASGTNIKNGLVTLGTIKEVKLDGVGDVFENMSDVIDNLDLELINKFATTDFTKLNTNVTAITNAITTLSTIGTIDLSGISDKGELMTSFLDDISDIDYDDIDGLAAALLNLADSYADLSTSIKDISDEDLARIQQVSSVSGNSSSSGLSSFMSNLFGSDENDTETNTSSISTQNPTVTSTRITPVMQEPHTITSAVPVNTVEQRPAAASTTDNKNVEALLKELISKVSQPVQIKIGDGPLRDIQSAISLSKSYTANINGFR